MSVIFTQELMSNTFNFGRLQTMLNPSSVIAEPFAATVSKPLMPYLMNFITPSIYKYNDDKVDSATSPQTFGQPISNLISLGYFNFANSGFIGDTQIIEYKIKISELETAFSRTYQNGKINSNN